MAAKWICDGCGKEAPALAEGRIPKWSKPQLWFSRSDDDGIQDACSRACVDQIASATGKTNLVMPL